MHYKKEHGLPPSHFVFRKKSIPHYFKRSWFVVLASYKKKIIAGSIFIHAGGPAMYKYGASDKSFNI